MKVKIEYNLQVTATPGFHSLYDLRYQAMWLLSGVPEDPEDNTVIEKHGADTLYSAVTSLMHAIPTDDEEAEQDVAYQVIHISKLWTIRKWSESNLPIRKPLI
jgi:hypothetical protein